METLPSGSLRVKVYAGVDPILKRAHYLMRVIPAGPDAAKLAEKARTEFLNQVDQQRQPRTAATVNQLLDRYFELLQVEENTLTGYTSLARIHIRPLIGEQPLSRIDGELLDSFDVGATHLPRALPGRKYVEHRTTREHECDGWRGPHVCRLLGEGSIRKIHAVLSGAGKLAVRWDWHGVNPFDLAETLPTSRPDPKPPTAEQAAAIVTEAWADLDWGMLVWLAMTTGARRGELCALKWDRLDFGTDVLTIRSSIGQRGGRTWEKDTKTHQQRRITLDPQTMSLLRAFRKHCAHRAGLGDEMPGDARMFSLSPDGSTWIKPDTLSPPYARMCARLGGTCTFTNSGTTPQPN